MTHHGSSDNATTQPPSSAEQADVPTLQVDVIWGDIRRVEGDVYAVGHYEQVLPQNAERALDRVVSALTPEDVEDPHFPESRLVLTNLTRRGLLRGALGEVDFFPWTRAASGGAPRLVAVAGMGHPGRFGPPQLRRLARNLTWAVAALPDVTTICTVLIGAGAGNMLVAEAVTGMLSGLVDALGPDMPGTGVRHLRFVEMELGRARAIHRQLVKLRDAKELKRKIRLELAPEVDVDPARKGTLGDDYCMALTLAAAASLSGDETRGAEVLRELFAAVQKPPTFPDAALRALRSRVLGDLVPGQAPPDVSELAAKLAVEFTPRPRASNAPSRLSFVRDGAMIRAAALTDTAVVPERPIMAADDAVLGQLIAEMTNPTPKRVSQLSALLTRLLVHRDFRETVERADVLVCEVDRELARVHWEMLADRLDGVAPPQPVGLQIQIARQLRTAYSPAPGAERAVRKQLRAIVIGDPGDPREGASLEFARREALEVTRLLREWGVEVTAFIGPPSAPREGELQNVAPAKLLAVLNELMKGDFDILHYAGHGDFDAKRPDTAGWVFEGGMLTSRHLELIDIAPSLVFANACLSAVTASARPLGTTPDAQATAGRPEADLLPGLADEFFRRGVRNYIGTAWRVNDEGAVHFAREFYTALLTRASGDREAQPTIGSALLRARRASYNGNKFGTLWAAYQHYGDPQHSLAVPEI